MNNIQKATMWGGRALMWAIKWSIVGVIGGTIVGLIVIGNEPNGIPDQGVAVLACAACGVMVAGGLAAIIPALLAMWFLFLHMVQQASDAARGNKASKHDVNVSFGDKES